MLSNDFEVLTPLDKTHRVSRQIADTETFTVEPGQWVLLDAAGRVATVVGEDLSAASVVELAINHAVAGNNELSNYEGNDTKVGRIATILEPGIRVAVGSGLFTGTATMGLPVYVDTTTGGFTVDAATDDFILIGKVTGVGDLVEVRLVEPTVVTIA